MINQTAIVIKSTDYKESDKLLKLFTAEGSVISAVAKGVKKSGAKLKGVAQIFSFAEFSLAEKNGFYTVTGASPIESLYALTANPTHYVAAAIMLEAVDHIASIKPSPTLFVDLLKGFKSIVYSNIQAEFVAAFFLYTALKEAGYQSHNDTWEKLTLDTLPDCTTHQSRTYLTYAIEVFARYMGVSLKSATALQ